MALRRLLGMPTGGTPTLLQFLSQGPGWAASALLPSSAPAETSASNSTASAPAEADASRLARQISHAAASTSRPLSALLSSSDPYASSHTAHQNHSLVFSRGLKVIKRTFPLPPSVRESVERELAKAKEKPPPPAIPAPQPTALQPESRRVGCMAYKVGMTHEWDEHGAQVPLTILWIDDCQVVDFKYPELHGYWALVLGLGYKPQRYLHPGEIGYFLKQGVPFKAFLSEFPVSEDCLLPVGTSITAAHYVPGMSVDVVGWTKNKGFQGVMKRWGFAGMPASHGTSKTHRHGGSIGQRTRPGKVWKGKKMPGQMGHERRTVHHVLVYKVDAARNLVYVKGQVPGPAGHHVLLRDAYNVRFPERQSWNAPHPTYLGEGAAVLADLGKVEMLRAVSGDLEPPKELPLVEAFKGNKDPYHMYQKDTDYFEVTWKKSD